MYMLKHCREYFTKNKVRGCGLEPNTALGETTPECFISCSARANAVLSTDLMYKSGVSIGKKGSD